MWSPINRVGIIEPEGILNAWTTNTRMAKASSIATTMASAYSRNTDFRAGCTVLDMPSPVAASGARDAISSVLWRLGSTLIRHRLQDGQEGFLRHFHAADGFHPFLSFFLFFEKFAFAGNVTAVAFCGDILLHRSDGLAGDNFVADCRLDGDLEHLPRNQLFHFLSQLPTSRVGPLFVRNK